MDARALIVCLLAAAPLVAGCGGSSSNTSSNTSASTPASTQAAAGATGPEGVAMEQGPALAPGSSTTPGTTVDGIQCAPLEQLTYHIHVHLQVYVNGQPRQLPPGIGLIGPVAQQTPAGPFYGAQKCYYWLHTHSGDGIIHIESPTARIYTLGNFFDEWHQPLTATQVGPATGKVTASVNGKPWTGDPRSIPLAKHNVIQLNVGSPAAPFQAVSWAQSQL